MLCIMAMQHGDATEKAWRTATAWLNSMAANAHLNSSA
jgi:hypothetical protein